jgi:hypothetical protein
LLAAALYHADHGACPAGTATAQASAAPRIARQQPTRPAWAGRLLR